MADTLDAAALANLLDDLMAWLKANPNGDLEDFAAEHDCSIEDVSDSWNTYFSADFSRKYDIDTEYNPGPPPHGDPEALKSYIVKEVNTYQEFTTINNIEDNSFNQQIIAGGDVNQNIDIDNSDNIADDGGVVIRDSELDDTNVVTGDRNVVDSDGNNITGDVTTTAGEGGQAATNIGFGDGDINNNQQSAEVNVTNTGDNTGGSADGTGGAGGNADADADGGRGGAGGDGGDGGDLDDPFLGVGGAAGDGGDGGRGGNADADADADGGAGTGGTGGDAGNDTDVTVNF
ncbi:MAG: hypothetical protein ACT4RN_19250 [Pseudonocardia sp.]